MTNAYTTGVESRNYFTTLIAFPTDGSVAFRISFDWKCYGEGSSYDYLKVYMVPVEYELSHGNEPASRYAITGNLNGSINWNTKNITLDAAGRLGTMQKLVFMWRNDSSDGNPPPAAVDNLSITSLSCIAPASVAYQRTENASEMIINITSSNPTETTYQIEYKPVSSLPTKMKLLVDWDIDTSEYMIGKKVDKERVLSLYNEKKKVRFEEEQVTKYQSYIDECNEKYLKDEAFWEFETLQIFVSDENPFSEAYKILNDFSSYDIGDKCVIVGIISKIQKKKTKKGQQFAFANIYSGDGIIEVTIWPDALQKFQDLIVKGQQVAVLGKKDGDDKMIVDKIKGYDRWLIDVTKKLNKNKF
jgi:DNA polymerase-3 subunit alpha